MPYLTPIRLEQGAQNKVRYATRRRSEGKLKDIVSCILIPSRIYLDGLCKVVILLQLLSNQLILIDQGVDGL